MAAGIPADECVKASEKEEGGLRQPPVLRATSRLFEAAPDKKSERPAGRALSLRSPRRRSHMTKFRILGAAAILASALASPALAQEVMVNPGKCAQYYPNANCQNYGPGNPYTGNYQRDAGYRQNGTWHNSYNRSDGDRWSDRNSGFWPAGVAAGAVGTAAAIATAPLGSDAYARQNGFVCTPGTFFRGEDGRRHLCQ
jgi:hypothetical protein